jgi:penicillin amidase
MRRLAGNPLPKPQQHEFAMTSSSHKRNLNRLLPLLLTGLLGGCAVLKPLPDRSTIDDRLAALPTTNLPIEKPVTIAWDEFQIPYILAETDGDAAFALGLVHAHLRLGQMAIYRRIAQGRIAEMGGPLATDIDHGVRILDFRRAVPAIVAAMPEATRHWLDRFVAGINHYQATTKTLPYEYEVLGLEPEPWTKEDILTFGRLAGTDATWLVWFSLFELRQRPDWPEIWARLIGAGEPPLAGRTNDQDSLSRVIADVSRSGSNSLAVAPSRSRSGGALIANDPHLGLNLPNTWLIAGLKSPSYHAVGLMVPGLPFFAIGRNQNIAWGGTNMRAATSDLVDVSDAAAVPMQQRQQRIKVRWWPDQVITLRDTPYGPVVSDAPQLRDTRLPPLALRWVGHQPSDEVTAMLAVARAGDFEEFRQAFASFAVSAQTMLYADRNGTIGKVFAAHVPDRSGPPPADMVLTPAASDALWARMQTVQTLPAIVNPGEGFLASANNRPTVAGADVGYFFSPDDRVQRMAQLVNANGRLDIDALRDLQRDVYVESSVALRDTIVQRIRDLQIDGTLSPSERDVLRLMVEWDGYYRAEDRGPVAFELFRSRFTEDFYAAVFGASDWAAFAGVGQINQLLQDDLRAASAATLEPLLRASLAAAAARIDEYPSWGDMHRLQLGHPLRFLPVVGSRFRFADYPIGGTTDALMKTAHGRVDGRHAARYGANARHVSDLSDPDANYFIVLGGQDGWLNSANFMDQVPLWLEGRYVQMPLTAGRLAARFTRRTVLSP